MENNKSILEKFMESPTSITVNGVKYLLSPEDIGVICLGLKKITNSDFSTQKNVEQAQNLLTKIFKE